MTGVESESLFNDCLNAKSWQRTLIIFFDNSVLQPRDTAFFETHFDSYSGEKRMPVGWNEGPPALCCNDTYYDRRLRIRAGRKVSPLPVCTSSSPRMRSTVVWSSTDVFSRIASTAIEILC